MNALLILMSWMGACGAAQSEAGELEPRLRSRLEALKRIDPGLYHASDAVRKSVDGALDRLEGHPRLVDLVLRFGLAGRAGPVISVLERHPRHPLGSEAAAWLLESGAVPELKRRLARDPSSPLLDLLARSAAPRALELVVPLLFGEPAGQARRVLPSLCMHQEGARRLLRELEARPFGEARSLALEARLLLRRTPWTELRKRLEKLFPEGQRRPIGGEFDVARLAALEGDAERGEAVFLDPARTCVLCHRIGAQGRSVGPDLSEIGRKLGKEALYDAILYPGAGISVGFEGWEVATRSGQEHVGVLISDGEEGVALRNLLGDRVSIPRAEIFSQRQLEASLMPEGLGLAIGRDSLVDLVEYLAGLGR